MRSPELEQVVSSLRSLAEAGTPGADEATGKALLRAIGVATPSGRVVSTADAAVRAAEELGVPVAVKTAAANVAHKSDVGGVVGPLDSGEVRDAAAAMLSRLGGQLLVETWEFSGVECFFGLSFRGPLGPVVSVGVGGIWVEVLRDVAHRAAPVTADEATAALSGLRGALLLQGGRGGSPVDLDALGETVARISRLVLEPELSELVDQLDVNPLLARADGPPLALDCTIVLATDAAAPSIQPDVAQVA